MIKDLGIVICNFNKLDYLKGCLETLYKSNLKNLSYEVIVVDNASSDGSAEFVKENYPSIILLENKENTGGSGGFDRGIRFAKDQGYKYVSLLDNDILLEVDTISKLINYIQKNPNVGIVGSKICTMDNPNILQELGSFIDWDNSFNVNTPYKGHIDDSNLPDVVKCDYVPACCLLTTNEVITKVGSFNTEHFIYWDDMDWCTRVKNAGYEIHAINDSRVFHKMGASNHVNTFGVYYFERNRILFFLKYLSDDKLELFMKEISTWLLSVIFFSSEKKTYATPTSLLLGLDDLLTKNLGKQDNSILKKEQNIDIFKKYDMERNKKVVFVFNGDMNANRNIYLSFNKYFTNNNCAIFSNNKDALLDSFDTKTINKEELNDYDIVINTYNHILDYKEKDRLEHNNVYIIDAYFNSCEQNMINQLILSYDKFKDIYENIFEPVIFEKIRKIRKLYISK